MKSKIKILTLILLLTTSCAVLSRQSETQPSNVSIQVFYDELSPYGQWIDYANYGYVWIPNVESGFVPYSTDGYWIMTNYGWTWASNYNWGWAAFHYGRWSFNDSYGWFWVPGNEWGPAWVNWRQADGYYGWEPMEPGMTIDESFGSQYDSNDDHWVFVRYRDFDRRNVNQYYVNSYDRNRIARNSVVINHTDNDNIRHTRFVTGPSRNEVQNTTGRNIVPLTVQNNNQPGKEINNGRFQIYRPQIETGNNGRKPRPTRVTNQNNINQRPPRDASTQPARQPDLNNTPPVERTNQNNVNQRPPRDASSQPARQPDLNNTPPVERTNQNNVNQRPARDASTQPTRQPDLNNTPPVERTNQNNVNQRPARQPGLNNTPQVEQRNDNGARNTNGTPTNRNRGIQTVDPSNSNPAEKNKPVRRPNIENPQHTDKANPRQAKAQAKAKAGAQVKAQAEERR